MVLEQESDISSSPFDPEQLPDLLPVYYKRLFPFKLFYQWLSYGSSVKTGYFGRREFSFTLAGDVYLRYQSFINDAEMKMAVEKKCPHKIDIGAVYNYRPSSHRIASNFEAQEKELVFDIDMTDYDDIRTCCKGADICMLCWPFMTVAIKIIDRALREDFGFEHLLWVFSGRRGIHCWVCDDEARKLSVAARNAIAEYLTVVKGGEFKAKKVSLPSVNIHPSISKACEIIEKHFDEFVMHQRLLDSEEQCQNVIALCNNPSLKNTLEQELRDCIDSPEKWATLTSIVEKAINKGECRKSPHFVKEIMLQFCYPRLDINVTKGLNHLLKSPFCVHPKTGRICVPIDVKNLDSFDPFKVPTISQLCSELNARDPSEEAQEAQEEGMEEKKANDYKKTSLASSINIFQKFVEKIQASCKINDNVTNKDYEF